MQVYSLLVVIFVAQGFYCNCVSSYYAATTAIQRGARNAQENDWKAISSLTNQAYSEYGQNKEKSRKLFGEAAAKMEVYLRKYETNPESLSYLRALVHLGALYQNADNLKQARIVFEQCERHREFNSRRATLSVAEDGRQVEESIANYVKARLCFLTNCSKPEHKAANDVVRTRGSGSSRTGELAPPFSTPEPKVHRPKRSRAPRK